MFSLNSEIKIFVIRTCHLLCWRPGCYHGASKTHVRDRSFKLSPIHASVIYQIPWIHIHLGKTRLCLLLFFLLLVIFSLVVQEVKRTADEVKILLNCSIVLVAEIIYFYDAMFQLLSRKDLNKLVNASCSIIFCCIWDFYCPPTKLREGNVFSRVCHFVHMGCCCAGPWPHYSPPPCSTWPQCTGIPLRMFKVDQPGPHLTGNLGVPTPDMFTLKHGLLVSWRLAFDYNAFLSQI